jgi:hypothetical protein
VTPTPVGQSVPGIAAISETYTEAPKF